MNESVVAMIDAGALVDPIDAAGSWRTAKRAAAALSTFCGAGARDGLAADPYLIAFAEQWLTIGLRTGWIARHALGREVDLDDVRGWLSVVPDRMPVAVTLLLGDAMRSTRREDRDAAAVALREWAAIPERSHHPKLLAFTSMMSRHYLTIVPRPGIGTAEWFAAAYLAVTLAGRSGRTSTHLRLEDGQWVVDRSWRDRSEGARATV